jgi:hypothetical protein
MEKIRRALIPGADRKMMRLVSRDHRRWAEGWKRNATYKGKPLTRSMIRRVGSRERAIELGLFKLKS